MTEGPESILSHGERDVAGYLRGGADVEEIAEARGVPAESVRKAIDRIEAKTERAVATLSESPFTADATRDMNDETREALIEALRGGADE